MRFLNENDLRNSFFFKVGLAVLIVGGLVSIATDGVGNFETGSISRKGRYFTKYNFQALTNYQS